MTMTAQQWEEGYRLKWPHASDDYTRGNYGQPREAALRRRYIQANPAALITRLVIDVDHEDALYRALSRDTGVPAPNYVAQSPSGKAHVAYLLETPVCKSDAGRQGPLDYAARIEEGLRHNLDGDQAYAGFLTKNPLHESWDTFWGTERLYTLDDLHTELPARQWRQRRPRHVGAYSGLARNTALFDMVRRWAYPAIRQYWGKDPRAWEAAVMAYTTAANQQFERPLDVSEIAGLARSVSRWTWRNTTPEGFSKVQAERGAKGGIKGGATYKGLGAVNAVQTAQRIISDSEILRRMAL